MILFKYLKIFHDIRFVYKIARFYNYNENDIRGVLLTRFNLQKHERKSKKEKLPNAWCLKIRKSFQDIRWGLYLRTSNVVVFAVERLRIPRDEGNRNCYPEIKRELNDVRKKIAGIGEMRTGDRLVISVRDIVVYLPCDNKVAIEGCLPDSSLRLAAFPPDRPFPLSNAGIIFIFNTQA